MTKALRGIGLLFAGLALGCNAIGPKALEGGRLDYNEAIARTWNEQLLRNLVRLKYRDTLVFLEITNVSTQYSVSYSAGASSSFIGAGASDTLGVDAGIGFSERPTITYSPLQGSEFVTQLLSPIPIDALMLLSQSGWSIERVLRICAQRMNELDNAASASGPTPEYAPDYASFHRAANLMRELQRQGKLRALVEARPGGGKAFGLRLAQDALDSEEARALRPLLGISSDTDVLYVQDGWVTPEPDRLAVQTRSLLGVLHFLSNAVQSPQAHHDAGWVVTTRNADGGDFDWNEVTGDLLNIHWQAGRPAQAFVATPYRGGWFYIADTDLNSKATFGLLTYLFYMQAGDIANFGPTLTLPVGQ